MFKLADIMFIYTESSLHCGSGTSLGVIDLPIQRERYTDYPVIQASGIKGAVREWFETRNKNNGNKDTEKIKIVFGPDFAGGESEAFAGAATFTDGRLLLFPIRSLKGVFAYTTSRMALHRFRRDLETAGKAVAWAIPIEEGDKALGVEGSSLVENGKVILEEYIFDFKADGQAKAIAEWLASHAFPQGPEYQYWREKVKKDLVILPDDEFRDFAKLYTDIQARIKLDNETKTVATGALFYEEGLHSDSLLYSIVMSQEPNRDSSKNPEDLRNSKDVMAFLLKLDGNRAQFGGDATIGKGIVNITFCQEGGK